MRGFIFTLSFSSRTPLRHGDPFSTAWMSTLFYQPKKNRDGKDEKEKKVQRLILNRYFKETGNALAFCRVICFSSACDSVQMKNSFRVRKRVVCVHVIVRGLLRVTLKLQFVSFRRSYRRNIVTKLLYENVSIVRCCLFIARVSYYPVCLASVKFNSVR